jgi:hypothetical protein
VQTGDRKQLINAENYYRQQQEEVNQRKTPLYEEGGEDFFWYARYFLEKIPLLLGKNKMEEERRLKEELQVCLLAVQSAGSVGELEAVIRQTWNFPLAANSEAEIAHFIEIVKETPEKIQKGFLAGCAVANEYRRRDEQVMRDKMLIYRSKIEREPLLKLGRDLWQV